MEHVFRYASGSLPLGQKTYLMGILNYTPDSFSDGARYFTPAAAAERAVSLQTDGADILDVGCCSTRPFGEITDEAEELRRLREILPEIRRKITIPVSVDTFRPAVAANALEMGADIINDVGGVFNPETARLVRAYGAGWVVTHAGGAQTQTADVLPYPLGVEKHVQLFFDEMLALCLEAGLERAQVCLDPGFGFAKTDAQNVELLQKLNGINVRGSSLLVGVSRKRFVGALSGEAIETGRPGGTLAAGLEAVRKGADILRVHDVALHLSAVKAADVLYRNQQLHSK